MSQEQNFHCLIWTTRKVSTFVFEKVAVIVAAFDPHEVESGPHFFAHISLEQLQQFVDNFGPSCNGASCFCLF